MADHRKSARRLPALVTTAVLALPSLAAALTVAEADCREGADFIANAARSRDNGMSGEAFKDRLEADLVAIRSFAPALRWFARDEEDAQLLRVWVDRVFGDKPAPARVHGEFLAACREEIVLARARRDDAARARSGPEPGGGSSAGPAERSSPEARPGERARPAEPSTGAVPEDAGGTRI